ncbi:MAG: YncE family protein [Thermoplasmata archaeon]
MSSVSGSLHAGEGPFYGVVDPMTGNIYVTDAFGNNVSIFSGTSGRTLGTVPTGYNPWGLAVDSLSGEVYVANRGGNVTVISGLSVERTIALGPATNWVLYDPLANLLYVAQDSPVDPNSNLTAISPSTYSVTAQIPFGTGCFANMMAFDASDGYVYVTLSDCDEVAVINATTTTLVGTIRVGFYPLGIAFDPSNSIVYVVDEGGIGNDYCAAVTEIIGMKATKNFIVDGGCDDGTIAYYPPTGMLIITNGWGFQVYHNSTAQESVSFPGAPQVPFYDPFNEVMYLPGADDSKVLDVTGPWFSPVSTTYAKSSAGIAGTPSGEEFVAQYESGRVNVISESTGKIVRAISVAAGPYGVVYDAGTDAIYVSNALAGEVTVINATTWKISATIRVGNQPEGISYDPIHHEIDVVNFASNTLTVISDQSDQVLATVSVGSGPTGVDATSGTIYVSDSFAALVSVVSATSFEVVGTFATGNNPQGLAVGQGNLFVADEESGKISVINLTTGHTIRTIVLGGNPVGLISYLGSIFVSDPIRGAVYQFSETTFDRQVAYLASNHPYFLTIDGTSGLLLSTDFLSDNEIVGYQLS